ncbi:MAG: MmgE/PrpD family protein [Ramlibacter sp.]|jgi:2-methylcitrate dehydratase PrpD|uniref:MmgE/PrpD family protein n=1 Tax=Ramlibacter sp. TaxID=1917967 RepID=UPI00260A95AC|nr:MmgE/PrpD family protein [Ramlibacter sp.]MDH4378275.1 MmgE/PrpD family protein [Ramlibacter sp.]
MSAHTHGHDAASTPLPPALTAHVARFVVQASANQFPADALDKARKVIADTFAVILSGADSEVTEPLMRYLALESGGHSPILGTDRAASPETAALINGTFGHALDFDDVLSMMPAHPSAIIVASLIADLSAHPLTGAEFIEAYVVGIEAGARIAQGITVGHYQRGFHGTGTLGMFSALTALAKAWKLDEEHTRVAIGIASSMASGVRRNFGTMTKPLHTGLAARNAVQALRLALSGFEATQDALEAKSGFFASYGVPGSNPQVAIDALESAAWVISDPGIALKKFACCYASHRAMDAVIRLREELGASAEDVARLTCRMPPGGMLVLTYPRPVTGLEGKFSLHYPLAAGLLDGRYTLWSFTDEAVNRPDIAALYDRIDAREDESCRDLEDPQYESRSSGSRGWVTVDMELRDGRRASLRVDKAPGHPSRELDWAAIEAKFADCAQAARLAPGVADQALAQLHALETCPDVAQLVNILHHGGRA